MKTLWKRTLRRIPNLVRFLPIYLREMTMSNIRVALDAFRPQPRFEPGFVEIDVSRYDPIERWEAACLITMTPGTIALDLDDSGTMLVHALYLNDPRQMRDELETLVRQALGNPAPGTP